MIINTKTWTNVDEIPVVSQSSSSSGFSANFNKLKALALELGVHGQRCAQFDQDKISVGADG